MLQIHVVASPTDFVKKLQVWTIYSMQHTCTILVLKMEIKNAESPMIIFVALRQFFILLHKAGPQQTSQS